MRRRGHRGGSWLAVAALLLAALAVPGHEARAQLFGYGYGGYAVPGTYYGGSVYGYPAAAFGVPYAGYGFGYGYPMYGYGLGYGNAGLGYGAFPYRSPLITASAPYVNPSFGVGLTPLGVNSALTERYVLGRGSPLYRSAGYDPRSYSGGTLLPAAPLAPRTR